MAFDFFQKEVFVYSVLFLAIVFYLYGFSTYFGVNAIWILSAFLFVAYFLWEDIYLRIKKENEVIQVKDTRDIRITFWR